jgi:hypothetical protein
MAHRLRFAAIALAATMAMVVPLLSGAYLATQRVQPFYAAAVRLEPQVLERGSREMESRATALYSDAQRTGQWQATFTADQINGWLMRQQADGQLPNGFAEPRMAFSDDCISLGFRSRRAGVETVVSAEATVQLTEAGEVAVRLMAVRAGALPLPATQMASELATACQELRLPVRWTHVNGEPVALVDVSSNGVSHGRRVQLDAIKLGDGELYVTGHTEKMNASRLGDDASDLRLMSDE